MSKLIGTGPNQVPSNADLGTAAFMDSKEFLLARGSKLSAIDATISHATRAVFVYDTSKDSDGGAWRKRCQSTSWYNEPLNTNIRGSRKEFPTVAIIAAEEDRLVIYDGDDPNLPMWMVFIEGSGHYLNTNNTHLSDVAAIEGRIFVTALRLANISFISDTMYSTESGYYNWPDANEGISKRNTTVVNNYIAGRIRILHNTTQGVAVMVRPNAPRDVDTGLLKPTIAVATVGGLSVIHDDDSVTDKIATVGSNYTRLWKLTWLDKTRLAAYFDRGYNKINCLAVWDLSTTLSADYSSFDFNGGNDSFASTPLGLYPGLGDVGNNKLANATSGNFVSIASNDPYIAAGKTAGVSIWNKTKPRSTGGIAYAHITAKYNTGWMMQDMRINTCASTTPGLLQDKNNVANSDFSSNITGWGGVGGTAALVSGRLRITATAGFHGTNVTVPGLSIGQRYIYSADVKYVPLPPAAAQQSLSSSPII